MNTTNDTSGHTALTIRQSASALGLHEFSVFSRIQAGDLTATRFPSGIIAIPVTTLERLSKLSIHSLSIPPDKPDEIPSDNILGITRGSHLGLKRQGEYVNFTVPDHFRQFTETEMQGYRAALGAIWEEYFELNRIRKQLEKTPMAASGSEICTTALGVWQVRSTLLNLGQSDILLCQNRNGFAVIERFREGSLYGKANGQAEILLEGNDGRELTAAFNANARHTLEYMASNQVATAQKVIWEQFPDHRPAQVVAAISERCRLAAVPEERVVKEQKQGPAHCRGIRM
jgi:hypothetical protein